MHLHLLAGDALLCFLCMRATGGRTIPQEEKNRTLIRPAEYARLTLALSTVVAKGCGVTHT